MDAMWMLMQAVRVVADSIGALVLTHSVYSIERMSMHCCPTYASFLRRHTAVRNKFVVPATK